MEEFSSERKNGKSHGAVTFAELKSYFSSMICLALGCVAVCCERVLYSIFSFFICDSARISGEFDFELYISIGARRYN